MDSATHIEHQGFPPVKLRSEDPDLLHWLQEKHIPYDTSAGLSDSQLILYGSDYEKFTGVPDRRVPANSAALCLQNEFTGSYLTAYHSGICHNIYLNRPLADHAMELAMADAYLRSHPYAEIYLSEDEIESSMNFEKVISTAQDHLTLEKEIPLLLKRKGYQEDEISPVTLCCKEGVTNSIFHGFREKNSHERKYDSRNFHGLTDGDQVTVALSYNRLYLKLSISDNSGILSLLSIANSMDRHHSSEGLFDMRGRGFYLMHHMADRLVIKVTQQIQTTIDLYFLKKKPEGGPHQFQMLVH